MYVLHCCIDVVSYVIWTQKSTILLDEILPALEQMQRLDMFMVIQDFTLLVSGEILN